MNGPQRARVLRKWTHEYLLPIKASAIALYDCTVCAGTHSQAPRSWIGASLMFSGQRWKISSFKSLDFALIKVNEVLPLSVYALLCIKCLCWGKVSPNCKATVPKQLPEVAQTLKNSLAEKSQIQLLKLGKCCEFGTSTLRGYLVCVTGLLTPIPLFADTSRRREGTRMYDWILLRVCVIN